MAAQNELDVNAKGGTELLGERLEKLVGPEQFADIQIIRSRFRGFDDGKKYHIFWEHDLAGDPESQLVFQNEAIMAGFDVFVFVSWWQMQSFLTAYPKLERRKCMVIKNGIDPIDTTNKKRFGGYSAGDKIRLIYTPTPHRGLDILVPVFDVLTKEYPNKLHLDVYSSFKLYGWEQRDLQYQKLFDQIKAHPDMTYHGTVSNEEVREALLRTDIFAYPSIWEETSCLCLIEAMSAECVCLCTDLAAIPETSGMLIQLCAYSHDAMQVAQSFYSNLKSIIDVYDRFGAVDSGQLRFNKTYADWIHGSQRMKDTWLKLFAALREQR